MQEPPNLETLARLVDVRDTPRLVAHRAFVLLVGAIEHRNTRPTDPIIHRRRTEPYGFDLTE